jgi:hypothetical protein
MPEDNTRFEPVFLAFDRNAVRLLEAIKQRAEALGQVPPPEAKAGEK